MTEARAALRNEDEHAVPVGPPLAGYRIVLEDADGQPAPDGAEGELVIEGLAVALGRSEEHTSELQSLMRISYAVFCLKKKNNTNTYESDGGIKTISNKNTKN